MGCETIFPRYAYHKQVMVKFTDRCEWQNRFNPDNKVGQCWYTDRLRSVKALVLGCIEVLEKRIQFQTLGPHHSIAG
jgi:hypothetical protein